MARPTALPFLSIAVTDWLADTMGLSLAEQGLLIRARVITWRQGPLPANPAALAQNLGVTTRELEKLRAGIDRYFVTVGDTIVCPLVEAEYERAVSVKARKQAGAAATNRKRWGVAQ